MYLVDDSTRAVLVSKIETLVVEFSPVVPMGFEGILEKWMCAARKVWGRG